MKSASTLTTPRFTIRTLSEANLLIIRDPAVAATTLSIQ